MTTASGTAEARGMRGATKYLWVVDQFMDQVKLKTESAADRRYTDGSHFYPHRFAAESEACAFVIERAKGKVAAQEKDLKAARDRLKRVLRKYGAGTK